MTEIETEQFLAWALEAAIQPDPRYSEPRCLVFVGGEAYSRFWVLPEESDSLEKMFFHLLEIMDGSHAVYVWPRGGSWSGFDEDLAHLSDSSPFRPIIEAGRTGAILASPDDFAQVAEFLSYAAQGGGTVSHDVFLISSDRSKIAHLDHHGAIHLTARDEIALTRAVASLGARGHPLPTELPDPTFKRPDWM